MDWTHSHLVLQENWPCRSVLDHDGRWSALFTECT